jgi:hypothetical protein
MDDRQFDSVVKSLGAASSRRSLLKGLLGFGGMAATGMIVRDQAQAARRGYSGPSIPSGPSPLETPAPTQPPAATATATPTVPSGQLCIAVGDPCTVQQTAECCTNACCFRTAQSTVGYCYDPEVGCF